MAAPTVYRLPRRFITFPADPPPYGFLAASLLGHLLCFGAGLALSAVLGSRLDQSKIYVVNLVPATPSLGSPELVAPSAPAVRARPPVDAPRPTPPVPKAPPRIEEKPPARSARVEPPAPPVRRPAERAVEAPPRPADTPAPAPRPRSLEPSDLALPRRVEKEPAPVPTAPARPVERSLPPPPSVAPAPLAPAPPAAAPRLPEPPRIAAPPAGPAVPAPPAVASASRAGVDPIRLGRPNAPSTATGSIAVDVSDFPFTYYLRLVQSKIGERWAPPRAAATGGERAVILFEIQRDGRISREPALERSSGNNLYDQSALRAVTEASPFPPLPPEFKSQSLVIHFAFEFQPDQG